MCGNDNCTHKNNPFANGAFLQKVMPNEIKEDSLFEEINESNEESNAESNKESSEESNEEFLARMKRMMRDERTKEDKNKIARLMFSNKNTNKFDRTTNREICIWVCWICGEEFTTLKDSVVRGKGHESCSRKLSASIRKSRDVKAAQLTPQQIEKRAYESLVNKLGENELLKSGTKYWFRCSNCPHIFESRYGVVKQGTWCPYCNPHNRKLCDDVECNYCWQNSLACALEMNKNLIWSTANEGTPRDVLRCSVNPFLFDCTTCGHSAFQLRPQTIAASTCGGCGFCSHRYLCDLSDCMYCTKNSALIFTQRTDIEITSHTPQQLRMIARTSNADVVCKCLCCEGGGHKWKTTFGSLALERGCRLCKTKTEKIVLDKLVDIFGCEFVVKQPKFEWCRNINMLPYDILLTNFNIFIEVDGIFHLKPVKFFNKLTTFEEIYERDRYKENCALQNGYSIIRLNQVEVYKNHKKGKDCWVKALCDALFKVIDANEQMNYGYAY